MSGGSTITATSGGNHKLEAGISVSGGEPHATHPLRHHNDHRDRGGPAGNAAVGMSRRETATASDGQGCSGGTGSCSPPTGSAMAPQASASTGSAGSTGSKSTATARTKSGTASKNNNNSGGAVGSSQNSDQSAKKQSNNNIHSASPMQPHNTSTFPGRKPGSVPGYTSINNNRPQDKIQTICKDRHSTPEACFYEKYDPLEGAMTAIVLGGFFAFVCLLVMYKTKCKPMWKNRRKRLTTTPATASVAEAADEVSHQLNPAGPPVIQQQGQFDDLNDQCQFLEEQCDDFEDDFGFECIPLQSVCNEEDSNDDIYFLDEFGNYVFPVSSPNNVQGSCSCPPSAEELNSTLRRVSQVSSVSAAYTVKSLPGAYLYIPVLESNQPLHSVPSLPSVKRALSDPQIHFASPPPTSGHPIILTVNPTSDAVSEVRRRNTAAQNRKLMALQSGTFSVNVESAGSSVTDGATVSQISTAVKAGGAAELNCQSIDINVIQPTPNISPSASLRSFDENPTDCAVSSADQPAGASADAMSADATAVLVKQQQATLPPVVSLATTAGNSGSNPSPTNSMNSNGKNNRRVSFSEEEVTSVCSDPAGEAAPASKQRRGSRGGSLATSLRQMTVPMAANATMSYLQVPGQQLIAPHLTSEAVAAQTSPQARRRRSTRLLKTGSFCSISSEGDGDIFGEVEAEIEAAAAGGAAVGGCFRSGQRELLMQPRGSTSTQSSGKFDPLSDYSEFHNDDACSDISDLFCHRTASPPEDQEIVDSVGLPHGPSLLPGGPHRVGVPGVPIQTVNAQMIAQPPPQCTNFSETGSIDEITYEIVPTVDKLTASEVKNQNQSSADKVDQDLSSCSLSIGSEDNNQLTNQLITVPVTIEHPPPEMRQPQTVEAACQQVTPASIAHHRENQTLAPSGGDLENQSGSFLTGSAGAAIQETDMEAAEAAAAQANASGLVEPGMRMVLVRDIGIQVCGDSPNLNLARKFKPPSAAACSHGGGASSGGNGNAGHVTGSDATGSSSHHHHHHHHHHRNKPSNSNKQDSLAEKFPAEILF